MASYFQAIHLGILLFLPFIYCGIEENSLGQALSYWEGAIDEVDTIQKFENPFGTSSREDTSQSLTCEEDLHGNGSLNTLCTLNESIALNGDSFMVGDGSLEILSNVSLSCAIPGCILDINISGDVHVDSGASITAGTIRINAGNLRLEEGSSLNTTGLGGTPPPQTTGTPLKATMVFEEVRQNIPQMIGERDACLRRGRRQK